MANNLMESAFWYDKDLYNHFKGVLKSYGIARMDDCLPMFSTK